MLILSHVTCAEVKNGKHESKPAKIAIYESRNVVQWSWWKVKSKVTGLVPRIFFIRFAIGSTFFTTFLNVKPIQNSAETVRNFTKNAVRKNRICEHWHSRGFGEVKFLDENCLQIVPHISAEILKDSYHRKLRILTSSFSFFEPEILRKVRDPSCTSFTFFVDTSFDFFAVVRFRFITGCAGSHLSRRMSASQAVGPEIRFEMLADQSNSN